MKIFIDTNLLISASWNENGTPFKAFAKAVSPPNQAVICQQNLDELIRVYNRKFPEKMYALEHFLLFSIPLIEVIPTPEIIVEGESEIRDVDDRPIYRASLAAGADILITGDKDLLESSITYPKIMTAAQFLLTT